MPPNKGADLSEARSCRRVATQPPEPSPQRTVETMELASMDSVRAGEFVELLMTSRDLQLGLAISGMSFYLYNELATMTIKATGAVTSSVANTAKRVIVMVYMAAVTGKVLTEEQKIGAAIAIGFVLVYSVIDDVLKSMSGGDKKKKA